MSREAKVSGKTLFVMENSSCLLIAIAFLWINYCNYNKIKCLLQEKI